MPEYVRDARAVQRVRNYKQASAPGVTFGPLSPMIAMARPRLVRPPGENMKLVAHSVALSLAITAALPALAQDGKLVAPLAEVVVQASAVDVASPDAIIAALYNVISGPAGKARDWNRLRALFAPQGKLVAVGNRPDGATPATVMTVDDYIARVTKPFSEAGFYETELARTSDAFGPIMQVFSTYESRHAPGDAKPFQRGVNSIQLQFDGKRWWIVNLLWRAETDKQPLPEKYLGLR